MYRLEEIETIHLELTSRCNARCPMCLRNILGGRQNPLLPDAELTLSDIKTIFPPPTLQGLRRIYACGNYGDPLVARETLEIFRYFREVNPALRLGMFTNGSGREAQWWSELARARVAVRFSVDGLEDTNEIYRRGTKWPLILASMRSFIEAGGDAAWDFIVFRHNEHQVETARTRAATLGFKAFNVKKTARFFANRQKATRYSQEVQDEFGNIEYFLEQPSDSRYHNSALLKENEIAEQYGSLQSFFEQTPVKCKAQDERSLYVSAEGLVFPCCWTAGQLYPNYLGSKGSPIWKMIDRLESGVDSLNAKLRPLHEVVEGPFFQKDLPESWNQKRLEDGRLFICGKVCGKGFDAFEAQFQK